MIKVYTYFHRRPDFADIQIRSLRKYLRDDFELTVFNNAKFDADKTNYNAINKICGELGAKVIDVEKEDSILAPYYKLEEAIGNRIFSDDGSYINPNVAVAYALCYAWDKFMYKEQHKVAFLAHDVFLCEPVSFIDYMKDSGLCYIPQARARDDGSLINYMWNTFFLADVPNLPEPEKVNWWCGSVDGIKVDVGGQTSRYLDAHPEVKKTLIPHEEVNEFGSQKVKLDDKSIIHYYRGSNWDRQTDEWHKNKTAWLLNAVDL